MAEQRAAGPAAREVLAGLVTAIGGQERGGQTAMAQAVEQAMAQRRHLVVQAGTGTGKSYAYLVPALLHAVRARQRVLVSTATLALQRQLMAKDIPTVLGVLGDSVPRAPRVALLKGRGNYLCRLRLGDDDGADGPAEALFDLPGRLEEQAEMVRAWAAATTSGDRDDLPRPVDGRVWRSFSVSGRECVGAQRCPVAQECFAEAARDEASGADLVVTNHTLLAIDLAGQSAALPEYDVVVLDEAHDLAARITQAGTEALTEPGIAEASRLAAPLLSPAASQLLAEAGQAFSSALRDGAVTQQRLAELPEPLVRSLAMLRDAAHNALGEIAGQHEAQSLSRRTAADAACTGLHDLAGVMLGGQEGLVRWVGAEPLGLYCAPMAVADRIGGNLLRRAAVVATSATMTAGGSFAAIAAEWGLPGRGAPFGEGADQPGHEPSADGARVAGAGVDPHGDDADRSAPPDPRWAWLDVGSPFDYRRQAILYLARDLPDPAREPTSDALLSRIGALVRAAGGRTLILVSSWRAVGAVEQYLRDAAIPGVAILVQERGSPPGPLVAQFAEQPSSVLLGTISLWQGVDVPGPSCSLVIIDKIPFPRPDEPVLAARSEAAAAAGRSGFGEVSLPHAGLLLAQGAGRLIRTSDDRGVVAVLDPRITSRGYGRYLLASLPAMWRTSDTDVVLGALRRLAAASDPA